MRQVNPCGVVCWCLCIRCVAPVCCVSQDGQTVVSGSWDRSVRCAIAVLCMGLAVCSSLACDVAACACCGCVLQRWAQLGVCVCGSVLGGACAWPCRLWAVATGKQLQSLDGHSGAVTSVSFSTVRGCWQ